MRDPAEFIAKLDAIDRAELQWLRNSRRWWRGYGLLLSLAVFVCVVARWAR